MIEYLKNLENSFVDLVWHCAKNFTKDDVGKIVELLIEASNNGNAYAAFTVSNYFSHGGVLFQLEHEDYKKSDELAYQYEQRAYFLAKGKNTYPETKVIECLRGGVDIDSV